MLELYHHGSSVCAAKARFALAEKGVAVDRYHYVDILRGEQFLPGYRAINARAVVPTLVHDGRVITESTLICEYVDDVFAGPALQPNAPRLTPDLRTSGVDSWPCRSEMLEI
jgi:glutathione S-transferase